MRCPFPDLDLDEDLFAPEGDVVEDDFLPQRRDTTDPPSCELQDTSLTDLSLTDTADPPPTKIRRISHDNVSSSHTEESAPHTEESENDAMDDSRAIDEEIAVLFEDLLRSRVPNTPSNRLAKTKVEVDIFPEGVPLRKLAEQGLSDSEVPVCGACLLDLFDDEEPPAAVESSPPEITPDLLQSMSKAEVRALRRRKRPQEDADDFMAMLSSCMHLYHAECISRWAKVENSCCLCKQRFGLIGFYDTCGHRTRWVGVKKTVQAQSRRAFTAEPENVDEACNVCHRVGDRESLMTCVGSDCDTRAHFYCLDMECRQERWKCRDCAQPVAPVVQAPQPSRRRAVSRPRRTPTREQAIAQAMQEIDFDDLHYQAESSNPAARLLPSEQQGNTANKSDIGDLILGTVSKSSLVGRTKMREPTRRIHTTGLTPPPTLMASSRPVVAPPAKKTTSRRPQVKTPRSQTVDAILADITLRSSIANSHVTARPTPPSSEHLDNLLPIESAISRLRSDTTPPPTEPPPPPPRPVAKLPSGPMKMDKQFISGVSSSASSFSIPSRSMPSRVRNGRPLNTRGIMQPPQELLDITGRLIDKHHPCVSSDLRHLYGGQPVKLLKAKLAFTKSLAEESIPPTWIAESVRFLPEAQKNFWQKKSSQVLERLCESELIVSRKRRMSFFSKFVT